MSHFGPNKSGSIFSCDERLLLVKIKLRRTCCRIMFAVICTVNIFMIFSIIFSTSLGRFYPSDFGSQVVAEKCGFRLTFSSLVVDQDYLSSKAQPLAWDIQVPQIPVAVYEFVLSTLRKFVDSLHGGDLIDVVAGSFAERQCWHKTYVTRSLETFMMIIAR